MGLGAGHDELGERCGLPFGHVFSSSWENQRVILSLHFLPEGKGLFPNKSPAKEARSL